MALTGWPAGPPLAPAAPLATRLHKVVGEIAERTAVDGRRVDLDLPVVVSGRAAALGLSRRGRVSANGSCRLLPAGGRWVACNLARPDDIALLPAVLGRAAGPGADPWQDLGRALASAPPREVDALVDRARLLGLPIAPLAPARASGTVAPWDPAVTWAWRRIGDRREPAPLAGCTVVDLSSLWAGPMVALVLARAGARVVKVESTGRPDGARLGPAAWYAWLHAGVEEIGLDFTDPAGRDELRRLLGRADVVIEASRPRALEQLGAGPSRIGLRAGAVWLSITGHGREGPAAAWTGFGDDAAVAGGLVAWDGGGPVFCGDAVADPATGMIGALAVLRARRAGGGVLIDLALSRVAAGLARPSPVRCPTPHGVARVDDTWMAICGSRRTPVRPPVPVPA